MTIRDFKRKEASERRATMKALREGTLRAKDVSLAANFPDLVKAPIQFHRIRPRPAKPGHE